MGFLSACGTCLLVCICLVVLVSSGGWRSLSSNVGVGDPGVTTEALTTPRGYPGRPGATSAQEWAAWLGVVSGRDEESGQASDDGLLGSLSGPDDGSSDAETEPSMADVWARADTLAKALPEPESVEKANADAESFDRWARFGNWASNGCGKATTRDTILERDLQDAKKDSQCRVTSGTLTDPYSGKRVEFTYGTDTSRRVLVDHVVSLEEAWDSGASSWSDKKRREFANDESNLLAASAASVEAHERSSADGLWLPDGPAARCDFALRRIGVKDKYGLAVSQDEREALESTVAQCRAQ